MRTLFYIMLTVLTGTAYNPLYASDSDWDFLDAGLPLTLMQPATPPEHHRELLRLSILTPIVANASEDLELTPAASEDDISYSSSLESLSKRPRTAAHSTSEHQEPAFLQTIHALQAKNDELAGKLDQANQQLKKLNDSVRKLKKQGSRFRYKMHLFEERLNAHSERFEQPAHSREMGPTVAFNTAVFNQVWQQLVLSLEGLPTPTALQKIDNFVTILPPSISVHNPLIQRILKTKADYAYRLFQDIYGDNDRTITSQDQQQLIETAVNFFREHQ